MSRSILLLFAFALLGGCADYGLGNYGNRFPDNRRGDNRRVDNRRGGTRADDYSRTREYRRITADAADYARRVDSQLRIGNGQERRIRDLLTDRTARLLQQTRARDHSRVYPFPRRFGNQNRNSRNFWNQADRDIERILGRQDGNIYGQYVRNGGRYDRRNNGQYQDNRRGNNGRGNARGRNNRDRRDDRDNRDGWGRDDGERGRADRNDRRNDGRRNGRAGRNDDRRNGRSGRNDRRNDDRRNDDGRNDQTDRDSDRRPGESLEEWYRRQSRNPR